MGNDNFDKAKESFETFTEKAKGSFNEATGKLTGDKEQEARGKTGKFRADVEDLGHKATDKLGEVVDSVKGGIAGLRGNKDKDAEPLDPTADDEGFTDSED